MRHMRCCSTDSSQLVHSQSAWQSLLVPLPILISCPGRFAARGESPAWLAPAPGQHHRCRLGQPLRAKGHL
eukprot:1666143-Pyramimonas_sp.AAC.1